MGDRARGRGAFGFALGAVAATLALAPPIASAGNINVTNNGDDAPAAADDVDCTLREAIQAANTNAAVDACPDPGDPGSADTVILGSQTYAIGIAPGASPDNNENGDFDADTGAVPGNLTIQGNGLALTTISGGTLDRVLHETNLVGTLTINGVTITGGSVAGTTLSDLGGGILTVGTLSLNDSQVTNNSSAAGGGGIASDDANPITITDSIIGPNNTTSGAATRGGGGIYWDPGSATPTLTIQGISEVTGNSASSATAGADMRGGGIRSEGKLAVSSSTISNNAATAPDQVAGGGFDHNGFRGTATFTDSTISGNSATNTDATGAALGGGMRFFGESAPGASTVTLVRSTLSGNFVDSPAGGEQIGGGALADGTGRMRVVNSTVSGNQAPDAGGDGGGIRDLGAVLDIAHTTFSDNNAADQGDAVHLSATGTDTLRNSIVAEGASGCNGDFTTAGYNVDAGSTCWGANGPGDVQNQSPQLGALTNNGGPTFTHAIPGTSPAVDRVPAANCTDDSGAVFLTTDQRGSERPSPPGGNCDSGAFELLVTPSAPQPPPTVPLTSSTPTTTVTITGERAAALKRCKKKKTRRARAKCRKKANKLPV
jgi:CSLREA domain-containing protein